MSYEGYISNSPSSFSRRRICSASGQMEKNIPNRATVYADEGKAAHTLGEKSLRSNKQPEEFLGQKMGEFRHPNGKIEEFFVDGEMAESIQVYVDHCRPLINDTSIIEGALDLRFLGKHERSKTGFVVGYVDFASIVDDVLHVVDYKHGKGVIVDVEENIQGLCYGLGVENLYRNSKWKTLRITIVQPRSFSKESIKSWDIKREELLDWKMDFAESALEVYKEDVKLTPSVECRFCKALFQCKGIINLIKEITGMDILKDGSDPMEINKLSDEQVVDIIFNKLPIIKGWFAKLEDYAQQRAEERNPLPGTKLVETRKRRVWIDKSKAEEFFASKLGEKAYEKKFKTAPQIEKAMGKKVFNEIEGNFVHKVSSGVTLAPIDDPRQDVRPTGDSEFSSVNSVGSLF